MIIRPAQISDSTALQRIGQQALGSQRSLEQTLASLNRLLSMPDFYCIEVAEENGVVLGYYEGMDYSSCSLGPCKYLMSLAVDPHEQGHGVGKVLLQHFEEWAYRQGAEMIFLISGSDRVDAHRFYEAMGYTLRKTHHNYVKHL